MDTAAAQWPQDIVVKPMEEMVTCPKPGHPPLQDRKIRPQKEHALNCPRCSSTNTKFCYYNNYSLSQPRYFCKTCRRYWTEGGSLRNIPVGGGSRKNKRSSSSSSSNNNSATPSSSSSLLPPKRLPDLVLPQHHSQNPNSKLLEATPQDLNLGFSTSSHVRHDFKAITDMIQVPDFDATTKLELQNPNSSSSSSSNLDLLTGASRGGGLNANFMPLMATTTDLNTVYSSSGFTFNHPDQFKPSLSFSLDGLGSSYGSFQGVPETNGKLLFPFEDLKQVTSSNNTNEHGEDNRDTNHHGDSSPGYWNGVIGNGGPW